MSTNNEDANPEDEVDIQFKPVIELEPVDVKLMEDNEEEVFKMRARLFRFDMEADPPEWKERGLGDIRMLKHKSSHQIRLVMRREKVLKICCNHFLTKAMKLKPHAASEKAFIWTTFADYADEQIKTEHLAIRFRNADDAKAFKSKFEELQLVISRKPDEKAKGDEAEKEEATETGDEVTEKLEKLNVEESSGDS